MPSNRQAHHIAAKFKSLFGRHPSTRNFQPVAGFVSAEGNGLLILLNNSQPLKIILTRTDIHRQSLRGGNGNRVNRRQVHDLAVKLKAAADKDPALGRLHCRASFIAAGGNQTFAAFQNGGDCCIPAWAAMQGDILIGADGYAGKCNRQSHDVAADFHLVGGDPAVGHLQPAAAAIAAQGQRRFAAWQIPSHIKAVIGPASQGTFARRLDRHRIGRHRQRHNVAGGLDILGDDPAFGNMQPAAVVAAAKGIRFCAALENAQHIRIVIGPALQGEVLLGGDGKLIFLRQNRKQEQPKQQKRRYFSPNVSLIHHDG